MAFDEISKVLFMKIRYERQNNLRFSKEEFEKLKESDHKTRTEADMPYFQKLFINTKKAFENLAIHSAEEFGLLMGCILKRFLHGFNCF